jgi:F0F1-type ATP synthase membrane subunit b/b'
MTPPNLSLLLIMGCFWVAYLIIRSFLLGPIAAVTTERKRRLDDAEATWSTKHEEYRAATERLESELEEAARGASQRRAEVRKQALSSRQDRLTAARSEADQRLQAALDRLGGDARAARDDLRQRAATLAGELASHLLEREVAR